MSFNDTKTLSLRDKVLLKAKQTIETTVESPRPSLLPRLKTKLDLYFFGTPTDIITACQFYGYFIIMTVMAVVFVAIGMLQ